MTGYLDLPVGKLRFLGLNDIANRQSFGSAFDQLTDYPVGARPEEIDGIEAQVNSNGKSYEEAWTFKPPRDKAWLIASAAIEVQNPTGGVLPAWQAIDFVVDGASIQGNPTSGIANPLQTFLIWGISPSGAPPGSSFPTWGVLPINLDPNIFLPVRQSFVLWLATSTLGGQGNSALQAAILVWEYYKTAPLAPNPNPAPAQTENESWQ